MKIEYIPVKGQKFDIRRTINPFKCDCDHCDYMHCPKNNYAVKMKRKTYTVMDFWRENQSKIIAMNDIPKWKYNFIDEVKIELSYDLLDDFMELLNFSFPKGTYWGLDCPKFYKGEEPPIGDCVFREISIVKFSRKGEEIRIGSIEISGGHIYECDFTESQYKLAQKISNAIIELKHLIIQYYIEKDADWTIGWLSPEGKHYVCEYGKHSAVAYSLGNGEPYLESHGWVKIHSTDSDGYFRNQRYISAEQRNWLSAHGYCVEEVV